MIVRRNCINNAAGILACCGFYLITVAAAVACGGKAFVLKPGLSDSESQRLEDMSAFNRSVLKDGWNLDRRTLDRKKLDRIELRGSRWRDVDVVSSTLIGASFKSCIFESVELRKTDLEKAKFESCIFKGCVFNDVSAAHAEFISCEFERCTVESSDFDSSRFSGTVFRSMKARQVEWRYAHLRGIVFHQSEFREVAFSDGEIRGARFDDCLMWRTGFSSGSLEECVFDIRGDFVNFVESRCSDITITSRASINDLNLTYIKGSRIVVQNLGWSEMFSMSFAMVDRFQLKNSRLRYASFLAATYDNSLFEDVRFEFAQFDKCRFQRTRFKNITLNGEILFDGARFEDTDFINIHKGDNVTISFKNTVYRNKSPF